MNTRRSSLSIESEDDLISSSDDNCFSSGGSRKNSPSKSVSVDVLLRVLKSRF